MNKTTRTFFWLVTVILVGCAIFTTIGHIGDSDVSFFMFYLSTLLYVGGGFLTLFSLGLFAKAVFDWIRTDEESRKAGDVDDTCKRKYEDELAVNKKRAVLLFVCVLVCMGFTFAGSRFMDGIDSGEITGPVSSYVKKTN